MSRVLLLDWDRGTCVVTSAEMKRQGLEFGAAAVWQPEQELSKSNAETLGAKLRDFLKANGLPSAPAVVAIGRDRVVLKEVSYPPVPASEEPALVRFQATKDLADSVDEVVLDYAVLTDAAASERRALAVIVRRDIINGLQQLCKAAGLKLSAVVPRPFAMSGCMELARQRGGNLPPVESADESAAVVLIGQRSAEVSILQGPRVLFSRSIGVGSALPAEVRRCLALYANQANGSFTRQPPRALYAVGNGAVNGEAPTSLRSLHETLGVPVYELDGLSQEERAQVPAASYSSLVAGYGLLQAWAKKQIPVNLASPKEPVVTADPGRRRVLVRVALAAIVLAGAGIYSQVVLARQRTEIQRLAMEKVAIDERFQQQEQDRKDLQAMKDWEQAAIPWIDEFYDLSARFPRVTGFKLNKIVVEPISNPGNKERFTARMTLHGQGMEGLVHEFVKSMQDGHLRAQRPRQAGQSFSINVDLVRQTPQAYKLDLNLPAGAKAGQQMRASAITGREPPRRDTRKSDGNSGYRGNQGRYGYRRGGR